MKGAWLRIVAMALKELKVVLLDRRVLTTLVISPIVQLILFGFATTLEVKNIDLGVVNRDNGVASEQFLAAIGGSRNIREVRFYPSEAALREAIELREVIGGVIIPPDLSLHYARRETAEMGLLLDGRRINAAQIVAGYMADIAHEAGGRMRPELAHPEPEVVARHWWNPNLDYRWFTLPGMITLIATVLVLSVSVQAIAREREFGTWDEVMALPLRHWEILAGKCVPAFLAGLFNGALYVLMIPLVSDVPFTGSLLLMLLAVASFSLAITGIGLAISTVSQNQQQAFLGGFLVIVPMMLLSGYASPVDAMPEWLQLVSRIDPLSHMLTISHGLFLKDMPAGIVLGHVWPMLAVAFAALVLANGLLRLRSS
jgi:ABC-2 type transport system permease protein